ncbi:hypothetical protein AGLY_005225 [Aphis glycines]|uniref:Uncharacterized protein n=1 Tax=Aphis glycines TaxID=307491 RepID=A0A6G0TYJ5_APHGL|nr:hypothetical protein AGLY_005225 [Aphis glycines]
MDIRSIQHFHNEVRSVSFFPKNREKKSDEKTGIFTQNQFSTKSIFYTAVTQKLITFVLIVLKTKHQKSLGTIFFYKSFKSKYLRNLSKSRKFISNFLKKCNTKVSISFPSNNNIENSNRHYRKNPFEIWNFEIFVFGDSKIIRIYTHNLFLFELRVEKVFEKINYEFNVSIRNCFVTREKINCQKVILPLVPVTLKSDFYFGIYVKVKSIILAIIVAIMVKSIILAIIVAIMPVTLKSDFYFGIYVKVKSIILAFMVAIMTVMSCSNPVNNQNNTNDEDYDESGILYIPCTGNPRSSKLFAAALQIYFTEKKNCYTVILPLVLLSKPETA